MQCGVSICLDANLNVNDASGFLDALIGVNANAKCNREMQSQNAIANAIEQEGTLNFVHKFVARRHAACCIHICIPARARVCVYMRYAICLMRMWVRTSDPFLAPNV